jgi:hypothetical protein
MAMELKASNGALKLLVHHSEVPTGVTQASSAQRVLEDRGRSCLLFLALPWEA